MLHPGELGDSTEFRYVALTRLGARLATAADWSHVATSVSDSISQPSEQVCTRLWGRTAEGFEELARSSRDREYSPISERQLNAAAERSEPSVREDGTVLIGLHASGVSLGALEVSDACQSADLIAHVAPIVACRVALLAAQGLQNLVLSPLPVDAASDASGVISAFAREAKRMLDHDRLSAYLLSDDGRSFERFAVATSPIVPGEGLVIPFEDVGLRHIVITNRPLVSDDLGRDARIVGREDRIIAAAGFRGLLSVPLRLGARPIGVLNFVSRQAGFYRDQDIPMAQQIADQISAFLENLRRQRGMRDAIQREATERERSRLTSELYRAVSDSSLAVTDVAARLKDHLSERDSWAARQAEGIIALSRLALTDVRRAVTDMSPTALDRHTLEEAVESVVAHLRKDNEFEVQLSVCGDMSALTPALSRAGYYVVQESLANVQRHASASQVQVEIRCTDSLTVTVEDDGAGFESHVGAPEGFGLVGMLERAEALGGSLSVESKRGEGTTVRLELPLGGSPQIRDRRRAQDEPAVGALRIIVAHPTPAARAGFSAMLEDAGMIRVVGTAASLEEAEGTAHWLRPDALLLDLKLAAPSPREAVERLVRCAAGCRVLLIIGSATPEPQKVVLEAGAAGSVSADIDAGALVDAVRGVASGAVVIAGTASAEGQSNGAPKSLSARELEILQFIASGYTNIEIGKALFLAPKTIERHVATIISKLGARNRAHAAGLAIAEGLVLYALSDVRAAGSH